MSRVLVVDDDPSLRKALRLALKAGGHDVITAAGGEEGLLRAAADSPDLVVLDLGLPDIGGVEVVARIREWSDVPVVVLSAADAEQSKVAALDAGADDYVTKPFGMAELEARLRALARRRVANEAQPVISWRRLEVDAARREARIDGRLLPLTARELEVLAFLARNSGRVCTHEMILRAVWGAGYGREASYLHAYIHRLRQKLGVGWGGSLKTLPGVGYTLTAED